MSNSVKHIYALSAIIFLLAFTNAHAQFKKVENLPKYDKQRVHFGFLLGVNVSDFTVKRVGNFNLNDSLYTLEPNAQTGFNLGIITNLRIGDNFDLRFVPALAFSQRNIDYTFYVQGVAQKVTTKKIESTLLEFPLLVKFKSNRVNNYRIYVVGGGMFTLDMVSQAKVNDPTLKLVKLNRQDYGYVIGVGFDFYMEMFKFSPELTMYHGIKNIKASDPLVYSTSIDHQ